MTERHHGLLAGWRTPAAPPELAQRVLEAARDPRLEPSPRRIEDRIWESRGLRAAWLAAVSALLAANLILTGPGEPIVAENDPQAAALPSDELDIGIGIPPHHKHAATLGDTDTLAVALLSDPCLDPSTEGDCT